MGNKMVKPIYCNATIPDAARLKRDMNSNIIWLTACVVLLTGCGLTEGKKQGERVVERHYQVLLTNGYNEAIMDYGAQFFSTTSKSKLRGQMITLGERLGDYKGHRIVKSRIVTNSGFGGTTSTIWVECQVTYTDHPATERFTLLKGVGDNDYKIVEHIINSEGLLPKPNSTPH
jgi:hypothetical protein